MRIAACLLLSAMLAAGAPLEVPFFRQQKNGCGAAALAMLMHYWSGHRTLPPEPAPEPQAVYADLYRADQRGIPLADMRDYAERHGFRAFTLRASPADLQQQLSRRRPVVVALRPKPSANLHFAVVTGLDTDEVWLNDPTQGKPRRMSRGKFDRQWTTAGRWLLLVAPSE